MPVSEHPMDVAEMALLVKVFEERRARLLELVRRRLDHGIYARVNPEEILSDVFMRAHQRWHYFQKSHAQSDPAERPYDAWLAQLARDCIIEAYRRYTSIKCDVRKEEQLLESSGSQLLLGLISPGTSPSQAFSRAEREQQLAQALALLGPLDQELLRLRYFEGRAWADIAEALKLTEGNVRVKHLRAVRRLKDLWKQLYGLEGLQS